MNTEIIAVGTELLHGDIVNGNAQFISKQMATIGVDVHYHTVVGDNPLRMEQVFRIALERADLIVVTGGLGPTKDDITKEIWAKCLGLSMEFHQESVQRMEARFKKNNREMTPNNLRQAYFPKGAQVIPNYNGTADACCITTKNNKTIYLLPGPPKETNPLMEEVVVPKLRENNKQVVFHRKIQVFNLGESISETKIMDIIDSQSNPTVAPYAGNGRLIYRVTAKANSKSEAQEMMEPMIQQILERLGEDACLLDEEE